VQGEEDGVVFERQTGRANFCESWSFDPTWHSQLLSRRRLDHLSAQVAKVGRWVDEDVWPSSHLEKKSI
jgi:hypothetical protein